MSDTEIEAGSALERGPDSERPREAPERLRVLEEQLEARDRRVDELSRALADVINDHEGFKRRLERERERQREVDRADAAGALIDAIAELRRAVEAAAEGGGRLGDGVRLIADELERRLGAMGITRIPAHGERFDPTVHEAVEMEAVADPSRSGTVVRELSAGWRSGPRVVRPARVVVAR